MTTVSVTLYIIYVPVTEVHLLDWHWKNKTNEKFIQILEAMNSKLVLKTQMGRNK